MGHHDPGLDGGTGQLIHDGLVADVGHHARRPAALPARTAREERPAGRARMLGIAAVVLLSATLAAGGTAALVAGPLRPAAPSPAAAPAVTTAAGSGASAAPVPELTDMVAAVRDPVVTIATEGVSSRGFAQIPSSGVGSGVILTADGYILTATSMSSPTASR